MSDGMDEEVELVYVEWVDSAGHDGWCDRQEALTTAVPSRVCTVGIVLYEDDESITLVSGIDTTHGNADNPITIPKVAITARSALTRELTREPRRRRWGRR